MNCVRANEFIKHDYGAKEVNDLFRPNGGFENVKQDELVLNIKNIMHLKSH